MASVRPGAADRARAVLGDFIEGRWEEARGVFRQDMAGHMDAGRISCGWADVASSAGSFEGMGEPFARQCGDYTVVEVPLIFSAGRCLGRVAVDRDGKVAGLSVQCPRRRRLDPRRVRIFVHGIAEVTDLITLGRPRRAGQHVRPLAGPG